MSKIMDLKKKKKKKKKKKNLEYIPFPGPPAEKECPPPIREDKTHKV